METSINEKEPVAVGELELQVSLTAIQVGVESQLVRLPPLSETAPVPAPDFATANVNMGSFAKQVSAKLEQCPINGVSLTRPACVNGFVFCFLSVRVFSSPSCAHSCARAEVFSAGVFEPVHPTRSARCWFIAVVSPTKHLFDQCRP